MWDWPDVYDTLAAWLSGISIEKGFSYETEQNTLGYRCNEHYVRPEDQVIMAHEPSGGHQNPSVFYDTTSHFPAGTEINFKARVASEDPKIPRNFNLAIWQMLDTAKLCAETQQIEVTDWQEIELTYVIQEKGPFRLEVYWHDNEYTNVLIDMKETLVMFRKTFE
ncbi:hypothetical protein [Paenibacillus sp. LK1]|uniref:hypothetical protein n=1 Tax=Paenibacillus sp. LK1 TaxID=2053014 RepID=UPI000C177A1F|nr:hypothetical protein [Paenibacillus sp. LK1]PIH61101.1 hypothetical protein CS562_01370 [Paenibacillus sp. LK1]